MATAVRAHFRRRSRSHVVLVHGLGGSGKSRLLRRFREMADGRLPGSPFASGRVRTVWLDWEDEQRDRPGIYVGAGGLPGGCRSPMTLWRQPAGNRPASACQVADVRGMASAATCGAPARARIWASLPEGVNM